MENLIVLVHSPLVGPLTWSLVAEQLQAMADFDVLVPTLTDSGETPPTYWRQHALAAERALVEAPEERPLILVGHSGAGALLPAIAQVANHPIAGYIFADAGLPHPNMSRLDEMTASVPEIADDLRKLLNTGGRFPTWSDEDLREEVPDDDLRQRLLAEVQPRPLAFFAETMPDVPSWPEAPVGYLLFTEGYHRFLQRAQNAGWPTRTLASGHFAPLSDSAAVATTLLDLIQQMGVAN
jgi:hypothetical protein